MHTFNFLTLNILRIMKYPSVTHTKIDKLTQHVRIHNGNQSQLLPQHSQCLVFEPLCADLANAGEHIPPVTCFAQTGAHFQIHYVVPETHKPDFQLPLAKERLIL